MDLLYKNNQTSNYIKQLLATTPLPVYKTVRIGDYVVEGTTYIYRDQIIKATSSGIFNNQSAVFLFSGALTPRDELVDIDNIFVKRPDDNTEYPLYPTDSTDWSYYRRSAIVQRVASFTWGETTRNVSRVFRSNIAYYDAATHKHLGDYLRCLRDLQGIDLLSQYNCFAGETSYDYHIQGNRLVHNEYPQTNTKLFLVPARFNTTYTIGIDCLQRVKILPVLMSENSLVTRLNASLQPEEVYLDIPATMYPLVSYSTPRVYTLSCSHPEHQIYEKYLYLAIEVPVNNIHPLVVLEGDFQRQYFSCMSVKGFVKDGGTHQLSSKLSLLNVRDTKLHVISDKLLSYLLEYTVDSRETITNNVVKIEGAINFRDGTRYTTSVGQWSPALRYALYAQYNLHKDRYSLPDEDILGYVDKDVENAIRKGQLVNVK